MAARLFNLLLCALLLGLSCPAAKAVTRPENRVGGSQVFSSDFATQGNAKPIAASGGNAASGYDFASGTHKYLYAQDNPVNMVDPSGDIPIVSNWQWGRVVHDKIAANFVSSPGNIIPRVAQIPIAAILDIPWTPGSTASIPDLVQYPEGDLPGQVYEIKPTGSWIAGRVQLYWYLGYLNKFDPQHRQWVVGSDLNYIPPNVIQLEPGVFAFVEPPLDGVILYQVEDLNADIALLSTYLVADVTATLAVATLNESLAY